MATYTATVSTQVVLHATAHDAVAAGACDATGAAAFSATVHAGDRKWVLYDGVGAAAPDVAAVLSTSLAAYAAHNQNSLRELREAPSPVTLAITARPIAPETCTPPAPPRGGLGGAPIALVHIECSRLLSTDFHVAVLEMTGARGAAVEASWASAHGLPPMQLYAGRGRSTVGGALDAFARTHPSAAAGVHRLGDTPIPVAFYP
jgi:hypothetical protein